MFEIIIKTYSFVENFLKYDLKRDDIKKIDENSFQINIKDESELQEFMTHLLYFSRLVKRVLLKKDDELIDMFDFDLSVRDYKLNKSKEDLNPILINYCLYQLGLDEEDEEYSIIDPIANKGEVIIETEIFASKKPLNLQKRLKIPYVKQFKTFPSLPNKQTTKNKVLAFVQDNLDFKELKENINFANSKIRVSKYELDWLDVKFKEAEVDFSISQIPALEDEKFNDLIEELLYMSAFVISDAICLISKKEIPKNIIKKHELEIDFEEKVVVDGEEFFITILE